MLPKMFILIFCSTSQAFAAYIEVTWYLTIKLFPAKSLWVGNNAKAMTSEAKINIAPLPANVDCSVRFTFINLYTQKIVLYEATLFSCILLTLSLSLPLLLSSLLINQEIKLSTLFLNYLFSHGCATFALWFPSSPLHNWLLLFLKGEHVPIRLHPLSSQQGNPLRALFNSQLFREFTKNFNYLLYGRRHTS